MRDKRMTDEFLVDPYSGKAFKLGSAVICRTSTTGVTLCKRKERERESWSVITLIIAIILVVILFTLKLEITIGKGSSSSVLLTRELIDASFIVIPIVSIFVGTLVAIIYMAKKSNFFREW